MKKSIFTFAILFAVGIAYPVALVAHPAGFPSEHPSDADFPTNFPCNYPTDAEFPAGNINSLKRVHSWPGNHPADTEFPTEFPGK